MDEIYKTFYVGINVFVVRQNKLLLGMRKNVHGGGTWGLPGGHLETGEAMMDAAARELMEETGLKADKYEFANIVNDRIGDKHYLQIGFVARDVAGEPTLKEPDRCSEWRWFDLDKLPVKILPDHVDQIKNFVKGINFADTK